MALTTDLDDIVEALAAGLVVALPTDTLYGLAADPLIPGATHRIFTAKRRPHDLELPVLVADAEQASAVGRGIPRDLAKRFWPGALTIVVDRAASFVADLGGDSSTVGLRVPDHDLVRQLCRRVGPLAITSANRHGEPTPPDAAGVRAAFDETEVAAVYDGGVCEGAPSTVIDATIDPPKVLREGRIPASALTLPD